jgi:hypothetical protein
VVFDGIPANGCANGAPVSDPARFKEDVLRAGSETGAPGIKTPRKTKSIDADAGFGF